MTKLHPIFEDILNTHFSRGIGEPIEGPIYISDVDRLRDALEYAAEAITAVAERVPAEFGDMLDDIANRMEEVRCGEKWKRTRGLFNPRKEGAV